MIENFKVSKMETVKAKSCFRRGDFKKKQRDIFNFYARNPRAKSKECEKVLGLSRKCIYNHLKTLRDLV